MVIKPSTLPLIARLREQDVQIVAEEVSRLHSEKLFTNQITREARTGQVIR